MSRVTFAAGDKIQECDLDFLPGNYERALPVDAEILSVGVKDKTLKLFYVSKSERGGERKKIFVVHSSDTPLPKNNFQYYFYVGTLPKRGLHVFELV